VMVRPAVTRLCSPFTVMETVPSLCMNCPWI
jgi:hypothetical protein